MLCWYFNVGSVGGACQWVAIRHRVRSELLHKDGQFSEQPLSVALSAPESIPHVLLPRHHFTATHLLEAAAVAVVDVNGISTADLSFPPHFFACEPVCHFPHLPFQVS